MTTIRPLKTAMSADELKTLREELCEKYEGELPDYLVDIFDDYQEKRADKERYLEESGYYQGDKSFEERREYVRGNIKEFFSENETALYKSPYEHVKPNYPEPDKADNVILTHEENAVIIKAACETSLEAFSKYYFQHYIKRPDSQFHRFLYKTLCRETLKGKGCRWAIAAPRHNAKSSIVSNIFPIWNIVYKKHNFILLISDTAGQAEDFLSDIKIELESNVLLQRDFPEACGKGDRVWRIDEILTKNGVRVKALGTGNKIRGRKFGTDRPTLIIGDDLENEEMVRSPIQRDFVRYEWFNKGLLFAGAGKEETYIFIVGTVIGKDSLLNALLDPNEYPDWSSRRFKAVESFSTSPLWDDWAKIYKDRFNFNRKEDAKEFFDLNQAEMLEGTKVLWPEGDPYYGLMEYKISNESAFLSEKQNEAVDYTKIYVTKDDLHFEDFSRPNIKETLQKCILYGAIDPSLGKKSTKGDYSAIITIGRDTKTGYLFVVDINAKRRTVDEQIEDILELYQRFRWKLFGIETNAFQYVMADNLRKKSRETGIYIPLKEINQYQDKKLRIEGIVPLLKDGTFVFDKVKTATNQMYAMGIDQITTFTGENDKFDDIIDAIEICFQIAKAPRFKLRTLQTKDRHNEFRDLLR